MDPDGPRDLDALASLSLDALDHGVVLFDLLGVIHRINPAAERILGHTAAQLTEAFQSGVWESYRVDGTVMPPSERPLRRVVDSGVAVTREIVGWRHRSGHLVLLRLSCTPLIDHHAGVPRFVVGFTDATEQFRLETELMRFGQIIRNVNDVIALVGETGETIWASPSNERVLGYPDGTEFPGGILSLIHDDDLERAAAAFRDVIDGAPNSDEPVTVRVRTLGNDWKFFEVIGVNLLDEPTVGGIVLTCRDVTERQQLADELSHRATHDPLTDLPNRAAAEHRLTTVLEAARQSRGRCGVCYLDLDGFKLVNDTRGHAAGDRILIELADRLRESVRGSDLPARIGGDEFVVILDDVHGPEAALEVGRRLLARLTVPALSAGDLEVGVSIGVATSQPDDDIDSLMARADEALYRSKAGPAKVMLASALQIPNID